MLRGGNQTGIVGNPKDFHERVILATQCVSQYKFTIPMVIDRMDGKVNRDYEAAPVRVTIVDVDGKVAFYAGRGPADFRIPPVERTLKKLAAHQGRMPPAPRPQWGETVHGLRCGLSVDPSKLSIGEEITLHLKFENVSDRPVALPCDPVETWSHVIIRSEEGLMLKAEVSAVDRNSPRRGRRVPIQAIQPGQDFETETEAKLVAVSDVVPSVAGTFQAVYTLEVENETLPEPESAPRRPLWVGRITSGVCVLHVSSPRQPDSKK